MSKEIEVKNHLTPEEAKAVFNSKIETLHGDMFVIYVQYVEEEEEEEGLIGIRGEEDIRKKEYNFNNHVVLAAGTECKRAKEGALVSLDPAMASSTRPLFIADCVFQLIPDRGVLATFKS